MRIEAKSVRNGSVRTKLLQLRAPVFVGLAGVSCLTMMSSSAWRIGLGVLVRSCFVALPLILSYVLLRERAITKRIVPALKEGYGRLSIAQKLYANSILVTVCGFLIYWVGGPTILPVSVFLVTMFYLYVAIFDLSRWYRWISSHLIGKAGLALTFAAASNMAYSLASQQVTKVVHVTPTAFAHTSVFLAIAAIPVLMVLAGGIIFFSSFLMPALMMTPLMFGQPTREAVQWLFAGSVNWEQPPYAGLTRAFQLMFYGVIGGAVFTLGQQYATKYDRALSDAASWIIFNYDMYEAGECGLGDEYRVTALGDAKFLVARKTASGNIEFQSPIKCDDLLEK